MSHLETIVTILLIYTSTFLWTVKGACPPPPSISNGSPSTSDPSYNADDSVTYTCDEGYEFYTIGSSTFSITCGVDGLWSESTLANCQRSICPILPSDVTLKLLDGTTAPADYNTYESEVVMSCSDPTYRIVGFPVGDTPKVTCQGNKTWDIWDPTVTDGCVVIACPYPITNGEVVGGSGLPGPSEVYPGSSPETFACSQGYYFANGQAQITLTCNGNGEYVDSNGVEHSCLARDCPELVATYGLSIATLEPISQSVGDTVVLSCPGGYLFADGSTTKSTTCQPTQTWSLVPSDCGPIACPQAPDIEHGRRNSSAKNYPTVLNYTCHAGYFFPDGTTWRISQCDQYGKWTPVIPDCSDQVLSVKPSVKLAINAENAINFGVGSMIVFGFLIIAIMVLDYLTFGKQKRLMMVNLRRFAFCRDQGDDDVSDLGSLDGDVIMAESIFNLDGRITPAASTIDLQLPTKFKAPSVSKVDDVELGSINGEDEVVTEVPTVKPPAPRIRLLSAKKTVQKALFKVVQLNRAVQAANAKPKNNFKATVLPLGQTNYGKEFEPRPPSPVREEDDDDSSGISDESTDEDEPKR